MFKNVNRCIPKTDEELLAESRLRRKKLRNNFAQSRTGAWGPTHSSDDDSSDEDRSNGQKVHLIRASGGTDTTREETLTQNTNPPTKNKSILEFPSCHSESAFDTIYNSATAVINEFICQRECICQRGCTKCQGNIDYFDCKDDFDFPQTIEWDQEESTQENNFPIDTVRKIPLASPNSATSKKELIHSSEGKSCSHGSGFSCATSMIPNRSVYSVFKKQPLESNTNPQPQSTENPSNSLFHYSKACQSDCDDCDDYADMNALATGEGIASTQQEQEEKKDHQARPSNLNKDISSSPISPNSRKILISSSTGMETANRPIVDKKREEERLLRSLRLSPSVKKNKKKYIMPFEILSIDKRDLEACQSSISELTMRSCYGESIAKVSENRRMAYYAVGKSPSPSSESKGKSNRNSNRNRRCYFSGDVVKNGQPFYAGCVQQGMRTLVVFCLPSTIGLPKHNIQEKVRKAVSKSRKSCYSSFKKDRNPFLEESDEMYMNDDIDPESMLGMLPDPSKELLDEMQLQYSDQYDTLPAQVHAPDCWKLYIRFCFFSGLPIADGDMYFRIVDVVMEEMRNQEGPDIDDIILSHTVFEVVNGELVSDIVRLPNKKTFYYLQKHYAQQYKKLSPKVFERRNWEMMMPEC